MQLAKVTDGAKVRAVLAYDGHKGQIPFTCQRDLTARKHPHTIRIQQQAHHHRWIKRRTSPRFLLIRGIALAQIQLGHHIEKEKHEVAFGKLGRRTMGLLTIALRFPVTIGFTTTHAHHDSPGAGGIDRGIKRSYYRRSAHSRQPPAHRACWFFFGQPPSIHYRDGRSGTAAAQRVPGDRESYPAQPDHRSYAVDGWRAHSTRRDWSEAGEEGPGSSGHYRQT